VVQDLALIPRVAEADIVELDPARDGGEGYGIRGVLHLERRV